VFPKRLKDLREKSELSQQKLADLLGITQQAVAKWEAGKAEPDTATLLKLSDIFKVTTDYLLGKTDIKTPIETIAAHRTDDPLRELPEEARRSLEEFQDYILRKYGKKKD